MNAEPCHSYLCSGTTTKEESHFPRYCRPTREKPRSIIACGGEWGGWFAGAERHADGCALHHRTPLSRSWFSEPSLFPPHILRTLTPPFRVSFFPLLSLLSLSLSDSVKSGVGGEGRRFGRGRLARPTESSYSFRTGRSMNSCPLS